MTGRRIARGKPLRPVASAQRGYEHFQDRLRRVAEPTQRVWAVCAYWQSVMKRADAAAAGESFERVFAFLLDEATRVDAATVAAVRTREMGRRRHDDY